jgi:vacuolar-type H+-ATPase subunit E/Vma4
MIDVDAARDALIADAVADAAATRAAASAEARERLDRAAQEAAAIVERARVAGEREAADRLARQQAAARREARELVLNAQRAALDRLHTEARAAARSLADSPEWEAILAGLRRVAVARLGPDATIAQHPGGEPGLVATRGGHRVDLRLTTLVDLAIAELGSEVEQLWT